MNRSLMKRAESPVHAWREQMSGLLDRFNKDFGMNMDFNEVSEFTPKVEVQERDKGYLVRAEVPGMNEKDLNVMLRENSLIIEGERKSESKKEEKGQTISEFNYGSFYRSIPFGEDINPDTVKASYKDGILNIELQRVEGQKSKTRKIPVSLQ
jgi:HSP20 family protein